MLTVCYLIRRLTFLLALSCLCSFLALFAVIFVLFCRWRAKGLENMFEHEELVGRSWLGAYSALCFSCGYFAYDQLDMLRYRLYSGWIPGILMHHLILLICFTLALYRNVTINYLILTLLCEVHYLFSFVLASNLVDKVGLYGHFK
jgi:hypothetical protein